MPYIFRSAIIERVVPLGSAMASLTQASDGRAFALPPFTKTASASTDADTVGLATEGSRGNRPMKIDAEAIIASETTALMPYEKYDVQSCWRRASVRLNVDVRVGGARRANIAHPRMSAVEKIDGRRSAPIGQTLQATA